MQRSFRVGVAFVLALAMLLTCCPLAQAQLEMEPDGYWVSPDGRFATRIGYVMRVINGREPEIGFTGYTTFLDYVTDPNVIALCSNTHSLCVIHMLSIPYLSAIEVGKTYTAENAYDRFGLPLVMLRYGKMETWQYDGGGNFFFNFPNATAWGLVDSPRLNADAQDFQCRFDRCDDKYVVGYVSFVGNGVQYELYFAINTSEPEETNSASNGSSSSSSGLVSEAQTCGRCGGRGNVTCSDCGGTGKKSSAYHVNDDGSTNYMSLNCSTCSGLGMMRCPSCGGSGQK